jgi:hypothetical protein
MPKRKRLRRPRRRVLVEVFVGVFVPEVVEVTVVMATISSLGVLVEEAQRHAFPAASLAISLRIES